MSMMSRRLKATITHWPNNGSDGYGGSTWGTAVILKGRWEEVAIAFKTPNGDDAISNSIAFVPSDVAPGDYLAEGDLTATSDPTTIANAWEVKQYHRNTDLRNLSTVRKAFM